MFLFLVQEAFPNFRGRYPNFFVNYPNFLRTAPIFGGIAPDSGGGIENVPREQRNSATRSASLNLLPKTKCVIVEMRQPKEVSLLCYNSTW